MKTIMTGVTTKKGNHFIIPLPAKRVVCESCDGEGTELYGGLKGCVISDENMADDDFREAYFGGHYDVQCSHCKGMRVVDVVDVDRLTPKMAERYWRAVDESFRNAAEAESERRYFERARGDR